MSKKIIALLFLPFMVMGQNMVQNPSFETFSALPTAVAQWNRATNWNNASSTSASPDYLHTSGTGMVQLPNSVFATVPPYHGNGIMGVCMWHATSSNFREYISQQLTTPLVVGNSYTFSFYVTNGVATTYGGRGIKNLQVHFSTTPITQTGSGPIGITPLLSSTTFIYSTTWIPITFTFTATAPYAYFAIGNFLNDANTPTQTFVSVSSPTAYYFIDQVSLTPNNTPTVTVSGIQSICQGNNTVLTATGATTYTWLPGNIVSNTVSVNPTVNTTYTVTGSVGTATASAVATVTVNPLPTITASSAGTLTCASTTVALNSSLSSGVTYTWSGPGLSGSANGQNAIATAPGTYTLRVSDAVTGCSNIATAAVTQNTTAPSITASTTGTLTCTTTTVALNGSLSSGVTYTWSGPGLSGSANGQNAIATAPGTYTLMVTSAVNGCTSMATTTVAPIAAVLPSLTASSSGSLSCTTNTVGLNGTSSSAGVTYAWSGPGIVSGATTYSPVVNLPGTYSMTVTETASGCVVTTTTAVLQNTIAPTVSISYTPACGTPTVQFSTTTSTNTVTYNWLAPATGTLSNTGISNPVVSGSGSFTVTVTNTINGCSTSASTSFSASPNSLTLSVNSATICSGSAASLTATGNATSYSWSPSADLSASTGSFVTATPNATSVYTITGTAGACTVVAQCTVDVIATPAVSIASSTTTICEGDVLSLTASGSGSYTWAPAGSLSSSTASLVTANPSVTTTYSVTESNGSLPFICTNTQSILITVMPKIVGVISPSVEICEGGRTNLYASGGTTVSWLPPSGLVNSQGPVTTAFPSVSTTYTALISSTGSCPDSKTVDVVVNPNPAVDAGLDTTIVYGDSLILTGSGDGTLEWIRGNYLICNHCPNPYVVPENNSCYVLQATTNKGCVSFDEVCVIVDKQSDFYIPNTFTPNGDGVNDVFTISGFGITGVEMMIFNRWGAMIYKTDDITAGWDGKNKGLLCENGVYTYKVIVTTITKEAQEKVGHVTLLGK